MEIILPAVSADLEIECHSHGRTQTQGNLKLIYSFRE